MRWSVFSALLLAGCADGPRPVKVVVQEKIVEVQRPCPVTVPARPAPIGALPANARDALRIAAAKLLEFAGPGGYADKADAALVICTKAPD
jgi:hypothetical protein